MEEMRRLPGSASGPGCGDHRPIVDPFPKALYPWKLAVFELNLSRRSLPRCRSSCAQPLESESTVAYSRLIGDVPFEHAYSSDGVGYYYRPGDGPVAIVLIHGMGGSAFNWRLVIPMLPAGCPLLLIDLPWCGTSRDYHGPSHTSGLVEAVEDCVSEVWAGPVVVVAHSIGGFFAWSFRNRDSLRVESLVLISANVFSLGSLIKHPLRFSNPRLRLVFAFAIISSVVRPGRLVRSAISRSACIRRILMSPFINTSLISNRAKVGECFRNNGGFAGLRILKRARRVDLPAIAEASTTPIAVIFGDEDPLLTNSDRQMVATLANVVAIRRLNGVRHFPIIETPAAVASEIGAQVTRSRSASAVKCADNRLLSTTATELDHS